MAAKRQRLSTLNVYRTMREIGIICDTEKAASVCKRLSENGKAVLSSRTENYRLRVNGKGTYFRVYKIQ